MMPFGPTPQTCPKCGRGGIIPGNEQWMVEFHAVSGRRGQEHYYSCYEANQERIESDHLHVECRDCRYRFAMAPKDAAEA